MIDESLLAPAAFLLAWLLTTGATALLRRALLRRQVLDRPNERSSHTEPTPRGGGWAIVPVVLLGWGLIAWIAGDLDQAGPVLIAAASLGVLSWADDLQPVPAHWRLLAHLLAAWAAVAALPPGALVFQGWLPPLLDRALTVLGLVWFINLFNFMDGIDGLSGAETLSLGGGLWLVELLAGHPGPEPAYGAILAGAALGFLTWNWHKARIFLGDVGSIPLGFLAGWLLVRAATQGFWLPALILPLYYLADATWTLGRRLLRGERIWQAHRQHFYQRAARRERRHDRVVIAVLIGNAALIAVSAATLVSAWAVLMAPLPLVLLIGWMVRPGPLQPDGLSQEEHN